MGEISVISLCHTKHYIYTSRILPTKKLPIQGTTPPPNTIVNEFTFSTAWLIKPMECLSMDTLSNVCCRSNHGSTQEETA